MGDELDFGLGDSHFVFTEGELNELLGVIEQKAAGTDAELEVLDFFRSEGKETLALQFQPRSQKDDALEQSLTAVKQEDLPVSALSSAFASPADTPALQQNGNDQPYFPSNAADISILPMSTSGLSLQAFALPGTMVGAARNPFVSPFVAPTSAPAQPQLAQAQPLAPLLPVAAPPMHLARLPSAAATSKASNASQPPASEPKGQISHSTVEKQRRDRINSLIDELRELVPPQQRSNNGAGGGEGMEARRPKHVVLADTIQLLKHLQQQLQVTHVEQHAYQQQQQLSSGVKGQEDDTANSEGKSKGSSSQEDVDMAGAPQMPHIPCQMTQNAGVTVERGPDCYYVQIKCRDRKGLLSDIINALRQLPLEIRTAAVTTANGTVRDVFEVQLDEPSLTPEDLQNLVHDALFQQHLVTCERDTACAGKRQRA
ncbi:hypothetical protein PLESTB_000639500 [Pleodorina starrii]|uniref:BHLH domain-containing protein n=1 Tax=Pleodorina starrii TaxID=330485 RepID=A0A9W6F152_9CHLO|nr:hypothetical protein PLESTM_001300800 [Pleodorina starrii]GLC52527.1 hypothetical protein PLESTB_000639500 [Pleodorina starrii]GLC71527.1 hypothetical protein PLESTF_001131600 [Pleodorina starrii]